MEIKFNITVEYDDDYITDIIENNEQYAIKTNTTCPKIENVLASEIEDLIINYTNAAIYVKINNYEIVDSKG